MAEILPFKRKSLSEKHKGNTLCRQGHHGWEVDKQKKFDVEKGKLVTVYRCRRCGSMKSILI